MDGRAGMGKVRQNKEWEGEKEGKGMDRELVPHLFNHTLATYPHFQKPDPSLMGLAESSRAKSSWVVVRSSQQSSAVYAYYA